MDGTLPVLICGLDAVLRDVAVAGLLCDLPHAVAIGYDVLEDGSALRTTVHRRSGVVDVEHTLLDGDCLGCLVSEDALLRVAALTGTGPRPVLVALPPALEPGHLVTAFGSPGGRRPAVLVATDPESLVADLFGEDLLVDRGLAVGPDDRRAVGEVLAHQLEHADVVLGPSAAGPQPGRLLRHVCPPGVTVATVLEAPLPELLAARSDDPARGDLATATPTGEPDGDGVWTVLLESTRPFHPERLTGSLPVLGGGRLRGRGRFWLPTRPDLRCAWDGAGGQLRIGPLGHRRVPRGTRLVVTGVDGDPGPVLEAFRAALLSEREVRAGLGLWLDRDDGLDLWLGPRRSIA